MMSETMSPKKLDQEGKAAYKRGDYGNSARCFQAAAEGYAALDDRLNAAEMANNCSVAYLQAGEAEAALKAVEGTPEVFAAAGDIRRQGMALGNLGSALEAVDRLDEAGEAYLQSAELLEQAKDTQARASVMQSLSALQLRTGRHLQALATMQAGLEGMERPSPRQRMLKRLLQVPYQMLNKGQTEK
jgi:tetratricopeptide (TPR) repeat protein